MRESRDSFGRDQRRKREHSPDEDQRRNRSFAERDPLGLDFLVGYTQFVEMTKRGKSTDVEHERRYDVYKDAFHRKQNELHFRDFSSLEWFKEK